MARRCVILMTLALVLDSASAPAAERPNILLILSDDQGFADYSFLGHPHLRTPHIDRLAREGRTFRRGHVPSSLCCPSLASIITGLYAHQHRITSNDPPLPVGKTGRAAEADETFQRQRQEMIDFIDRVPTIPRLLGEAGYVSFQSGKWWEGNFRRGGFTKGMTHGDVSRGGRHGDEGLKIGRETMQPVLDFIDDSAREEKPFFLWYAPMLPHSPHNPPERLLERYRAKAPTLEIAKYWAMCEWFDETIGTLLTHLDEKRLTDNTLVVYLCDNGWIQDPDADRYAPRSKRSPYEGGLRTPIIVRWPRHIEPQVRDELATSLDLAPTILNAAGLSPTKEMPGINLLDDAAVAARTTLTGEIFEHNAVEIGKPASSLQYRWIIRGDWKLIVPAPRMKENSAELFNLREDPDEQRNLVAGEASRVRELQRELDRWWTPE